MRSIATDGVALSVGLTVTIVSHAKRLKQSRCRLGCGLGWAKEVCIRLGCTLAPPGEYDWAVHFDHLLGVNWITKKRTRVRFLTRYRKIIKLEMWANAQRDGRPAECRWRPLFNATKFGWRPLPECSAVTLPIRETRWNLQGASNSPTDLSR